MIVHLGKDTIVILNSSKVENAELSNTVKHAIYESGAKLYTIDVEGLLRKIQNIIIPEFIPFVLMACILHFCTEIACCEFGFVEKPGWSPITGFGSVNYTQLYNYYIDISINNNNSQSSKKSLSKTAVIVIAVVVSVIGSGILGLIFYFLIISSASKSTAVGLQLPPIVGSGPHP